MVMAEEGVGGGSPLSCAAATNGFTHLGHKLVAIEPTTTAGADSRAAQLSETIELFQSQ